MNDVLDLMPDKEADRLVNDTSGFADTINPQSIQYFQQNNIVISQSNVQLRSPDKDVAKMFIIKDGVATTHEIQKP